MIAYKLLRTGRVAPFSGIVWPQPGEWLEAGHVDPCRSGLHACRAADLPYWLGLGELWAVELDGMVAGERKLVARRARLVRPIDAWNGNARAAFVAACVAETRRRAEDDPKLAPFADDIAPASPPAVAGYISARAAELQDGPSGYDAERRRQADWLVGTLGLETKA